MKIYAAINKVMNEVGAISKEGVNKQQGYKFRGIDQVMTALHPILCKHNVFVVPEVLSQSREERETKSGGNLIYSVCSVKYTFYADDGSSVTAVVVGEGMDSGDKATNKAMSVAFKYACFQVFCIPIENGLDDPDNDTPEESKRKQPQQATGSQGGRSQGGSGGSQGAGVISEAQAKRMFAISQGNAELCKDVIGRYGYETSKDVLKKDYEAICKEIESDATLPWNN